MPAASETAAASARRVPLVDLAAQYAGLRSELLKSVEDVLSGMHLFLGPNVCAFEEEFARYCETAHAVGTSSGTSALRLALRALGVAPGDEVITVAHTFVATVGAIVELGATPVLVDVDPSTLLMDLSQIESRITARTRAVIPVHLYGRMVDMPRLMRIARTHGLAVVEDACQAHGARLEDKPAGSWGDAACFSFYFSKNLSAYGETGMVVTNDAQVAATIRALRDHGSESKYQQSMFGYNDRPDELQAAMLRVKFPHLDEWNRLRAHIAARYREALANVDGVECLPPAPPGEHVYHQFVIRASARDALRDHLARAGVETGVHYPTPIHQQQAWLRQGLPPYHLEHTERAASEVLSLPMYPELSAEQVQYVAGQIAAFATSASSG